jgi:hypothetical protein
MRVLMMALFALLASFATGQEFREVELLSLLRLVYEREGYGLYSYELVGQAENMRVYSSEMVTSEGRLVGVEWSIYNQPGKRFIERVEVSSDVRPEHEEVMFALGLAQGSILSLCLNATDEVREGLAAWQHERWSEIFERWESGRWVWRHGPFEKMVRFDFRSEAPPDFHMSISLSRADSPGDAGSGWFMYCVHESVPALP